MFNWILLIIDILLILGIIALIIIWFFICRRRNVKAIEYTPTTNPSEEVLPINTNVEYGVPLDTTASQIVPMQIIPNYYLLQVLKIIVSFCLFCFFFVCFFHAERHWAPQKDQSCDSHFNKSRDVLEALGGWDSLGGNSGKGYAGWD